jgi:hypothetical protein
MSDTSSITNTVGTGIINNPADGETAPSTGMSTNSGAGTSTNTGAGTGAGTAGTSTSTDRLFSHPPISR